MECFQTKVLVLMTMESFMTDAKVKGKSVIRG